MSAVLTSVAKKFITSKVKDDMLKVFLTESTSVAINDLESATAKASSPATINLAWAVDGNGQTTSNKPSTTNALNFSVTENKKPVRLCVVGVGGYITGIAELTPIVGATPKGHGLYIKELKIEI